jgi:hypothetical protein
MRSEWFPLLYLAPSAKSMRMIEHCWRCAKQNTPPKVRKIGPVDVLLGAAYLNDGEIVAPYPVTPEATLVYLHECGHFIRGHENSDYITEFEAEQWAKTKLREAQIPVPRDGAWLGKRMICGYVEKIILAGQTEIDPRVLQFLSIGERKIREFAQRKQDGLECSLAEFIPLKNRVVRLQKLESDGRVDTAPPNCLRRPDINSIPAEHFFSVLDEIRRLFGVRIH